jgi:sugar lactone lactonase YvrE
MFPADARYKASSKFTRFADRMGASPVREVHQNEVLPHTLRSSETALENYAPPLHATAFSHVESNQRGLFNDVVALAYGHQNVLRMPLNLTTDSQQRVIVTDPIIPAVHVIDPHRKTSFRILGGGNRRLSLPGDVAVDRDDNVYIADFDREVVLVYDRYGRFVRTIGTTYDENIFEQITGIAIDRNAGRLYVADGPRHVVYMLDLQGVILKVVGRPQQEHKVAELQIRNDTGPHEFNYPTHLVVGEDELIVLDTDGTRIRILDLDCNLIGGFIIQHAAQDHSDGVGIDHEGRIYASFSDTAEIRVYSRGGKMLASFGEFGSRVGDFSEPRGLWIDGSNRLYVADTWNARVQVFQLHSEANGNEQQVREAKTGTH